MGETLRDGRFVVLGHLGRGSQGETFDARDTLERRAVAIKRFDVRGAQAWKDVELAEREARVLQSLSHPKLPGYIDHFESDGALYLVMEKIEGESLASLHARGVALNEHDILRLLTDASDVLDYLRGRAPPVIHRDLKPGNVIRRPDGSFAFVDFGAVRDKLRPRGGSTVVGTFGYMAPEQFQGRALPASDVYAIGATAIAMLTGREPEDLPHRGLAIDVRSTLRGLATPSLIDVLERMLTPDPENRAGRIGPLLAPGEPRPRRPGPEIYDWKAGSWDLVGHTQLERAIRSETRRAERHARRQALRMARRAMRAQRHEGRHHAFPRPVSFALALCLVIPILAVTLATRLIVPFVLNILALFIAPRALKSAATRVQGAGKAAVASIARGQRAILGDESHSGAASSTQDQEASEGQVRVAARAEARLRVDEPATPEAEHRAETLEPDSTMAKR
jgi:competence protein ComGC